MWKQSGLKPHELRGRLDDQDHYSKLALHTPIWRYIISRYFKRKDGGVIIYDDILVNVVGWESFSLAIELSQWGYHVRLITKSYEDYERGKKDEKVQAGRIKEYIVGDFSDVPYAAVTCFNELEIDKILLHKQNIVKFLGNILRRSAEVVFVVRYDRPWLDLIKEHFEFSSTYYPGGTYILIRLHALKE